MYKFLIVFCFALFASCTNAQPPKDDWTLIWSDEFDTAGAVDGQKWGFETGFVRNYEPQWYAPENCFQRDGHLVIEARPADFPCPTYDPNNKNWRKSRQRINWTSGCVITKNKFSFTYGRLEVRARIPVCKGAWPAIWLLGTEMPWPSNGEVDVLEYYQVKNTPTILANACWAGKNEDDAQWDSSYHAFSDFTAKDPAWAERFHVWRMDWDKDFIRLYLDDELLNEIDLSKTINGKANAGCEGTNPFTKPMYILLNLALDTRVKEYDLRDFPMRYEIDYVRVYQKK